MESGSRNVLIGTFTGANNESGTDNVMVGAGAGENSEGGGNVFIGRFAGKNETSNNKLYIQNTDASDPLIYGEFDNDLVRINGDLEVTGDFPGKTILADTDNDTKIQVEESADEDMIRFDMEGTEILRISKNVNNVTLIELPNSGSNNTVFGEGAGAIVNGQSNTLLGRLAGSETTSGAYNTFVGGGAGRNNVNGLQNSCFGASAGAKITGNNNTILGNDAARNMTTSIDNVCIGNSVARNNIIGNSNVMIGMNAGYNSKGSNNVFIGRSAAYTETGSGKLYIEGYPNTPDPLIYGEFDNDIVRINGDLEVTGDLIANVLPVGSIQIWPTDTPPDGWLICDGTSFNATTYPTLNTILGGNTLPDLIGRFALGAGERNEGSNHPLLSIYRRNRDRFAG